MNWRCCLLYVGVAWILCLHTEVSAQGKVAFLSFAPDDLLLGKTPQIEYHILDIDEGVLSTVDRFPYETLGPGKYNYGDYWSPDRTRAITINDSKIYVTDTYGGHEVLIGAISSNDVADPRWSPDGTKIALSLGPKDRKQICVVDADGGNLTNISNSNRHDYLPYWSPDGTRIAFTSFQGNSDVFVMDADGSNQVNLTEYPDADYLSSWSPQGPWSPDGTQILFLSYRYGNNDIFSVNADGSNVVNLTESVDSEDSPVWSPDGARIVYVVQFMASNKLLFGDIFVMNADGTNQVNLTNSPSVSDQNPFWIGGSPASVIESQSWGQVKSIIRGHWR